MNSAKERLWRRIKSDRGSIFVEYAMVSAVVTLVAMVAFTPGSAFMTGIGWDYNFRELLIKWPIF